MNVQFFKEFGRTNPSLPLKDAGNITHGNACRVDWESVCPKNENDEINELKNRWNKNVDNIFTIMLNALKMRDETKINIINNNYNNIIENYNKHKYYKNIDEILGI